MEKSRPILRLSEEIIGKIAAGEVVESPASAIKELVENSLDAGATCVTVEIRDGGISYLRVTDNGRGIPARDVRLAFERHATSKIRKSDDLFDLRTLGFRGEALASIAAVSKLTLTTRNADEDTGTRAINEGGVMKSITDAASPQGTTIVARELFYNTPVRLKFLKKPVTEAAKVAEVISRLILAHPNIAFRLIHNDKQIYSSSGNGDIRSAVFCLYGRETANAMIKIQSEGAVSVEGLVGVGLHARSNRSRQTFIVNGRTIKSPLLTQALEDACRERVTIGHYPICVLDVKMPNVMVDVNVHPNKLEVRFSNETLVYQSVKGAIQDSFTISPLEHAPSLFPTQGNKTHTATSGVVRVIDTDTKEGLDEARRENLLANTSGSASVFQNEKRLADKRADVQVRVVSPERAKSESSPQIPVQHESCIPSKVTAKQQDEFTSFVTQYFGNAALRETVVPGSFKAQSHQIPESEEYKKSPSQSYADPVKEAAVSVQPSVHTVATDVVQGIQDAVQETLLPADKCQNDEADPLYGYKMVGVVFDTYIILQNEKQMLLIDQHAAHERILYERLMRQIDMGAGSQVLMVAQVVHVTPQDKAKIEQYADDIRSAGFDIEPFGEDAYQIRAVPNVLGVPQTRGAFLDLVDRLGELRVLTTHQKRRDAILQMACKKAIKGGDKLSMEEIQPLLADMLATNAPPTCPHGRPLVVTVTKGELEKRFRRINN